MQGLSHKGHLHLLARETNARGLTAGTCKPQKTDTVRRRNLLFCTDRGDARQVPASRPPAHLWTFPGPRPGIRAAQGHAGSRPSGVYPGSVASPGFVCHTKEFGTRQQTGFTQLGPLTVSAEGFGRVVEPSRPRPPAPPPAWHRSRRAIPQGHPAPRVPAVPSRLTPPPTSRRLLLLSALGKAD